MSTETELKLSVDGVTAEQLTEHPVVRRWLREIQPPRCLGNVYFDTPDLRLQQQGIGLRLRRDGDQWLQAIKTTGSARSGLHHRIEWEMPVAGEALELKRFDANQLRALFKDKSLRQALAPSFRTDFERTTWDLSFPDGTAIEMVLDLGEVVAGDKREPISELELELKGEGSNARLFALAQSMTESFPMRVLNVSKAERGYRLGGHAPPYMASKSGPVILKKTCKAEKAFIEIMQHGLQHLQVNEPVLLNNPGDREAVHQMRVATRRLRSCLQLYRPLIPKGVEAEVAAGIKRITDALGPARDWDVFIAATLTPLVGEFPQHRLLKTLLKYAEERRQAAYRHATDEILSARYTRLLLQLGRWLEERAWREGLSKKQRRGLQAHARKFAGVVLAKHHEKVTRFGERFAELNPEERHQLRIRCKALRYAAEFFAELYNAEQARHYARAVAGLQDVLGVLNDGRVVRHLLAALGEGKKAPAEDMVLGWTSANSRCHLDNFDDAWREFTVHKPFWT